MKCLKCGFESTEEFKYCAKCGAEAVTDTPNPLLEKLLFALKSNLFLAVCILVSASCIFSIAAGGLPIINILISVFLFFTYASAKKGNLDAGHLRSVSGSVYAKYIIVNVVSSIIIVCGVLVALILEFAVAETSLVDIISSEVGALSLEYQEILTPILSSIGWLFGLIFIIVGVAVLLFNLLGMRKIHRFAKSVYKVAENSQPTFQKPKPVKNWLIFFAVCSAIAAATSISTDIATTLSEGCNTAAMIVSAVLIDKFD